MLDKYFNASIENSFLNEDYKQDFLDLIRDTTEQVFDVLSSKEAVINSKLDFNTIRDKFDDKNFPEKQNYKDMNEVVDMLLKAGPVPNFGSPNFIGQMHPALNISSIVANNIAGILNQNLIAEEVSPVFTQMENQVIGYLADIIGYDPEKAGGTIVAGGTIANLTAMMIARNSLLSGHGGGVAEIGVIDSIANYNEINGTDYKDITLIVGEDAHYSINKLAGYVGIGNKKVKEIRYTEDNQLDLDHLEALIQESEQENKLIVGVFITAGTTEKGHVHNISGVLNIAKNKGQNGRELYLHVDAAHGGGYLVKEEIKNKYFKDIERADSVTIDGHKMLYTNYSCGGIILKDKFMSNNIKQSANYILREDSLNENHGKYTIEGSRSTSGVFQLWSTINTLGKEGYCKLIDKTLENAKLFRKLIDEDEELEVLSGDSPLNLVCFRHHPKGVNDEKQLNEINKKLKDLIYKDGESYIGDTEIDNKACFRSVLMNYSIGEEHLVSFINKLKQLYSTI